jgi:hypothetical protein
VIGGLSWGLYPVTWYYKKKFLWWGIFLVTWNNEYKYLCHIRLEYALIVSRKVIIIMNFSFLSNLRLIFFESWIEVWGWEKIDRWMLDSMILLGT